MIPEKYKKYIPYIICGCILIFISSLYFNRTGNLENKIIESQKDAAVNEALAKEYKHQSELSEIKAEKTAESRDSIQLLLDNQTQVYQTFKKQYNEKIKNVENFSISDMQSYWDSRYEPIEKSSTRFDTIKKRN